MKRTLLLLSLALSQMAFCQSPLQSISFELVENLIFFQLKVNESDELNFLFDTGAGVTVVDTATAQAIGLAITGTSRLSTAGKSVDAQTSDGNALYIGEAELRDVSLEILSLTHLSEYLGRHIDGVIGYDLLRAFIVETNVDDRQAHLYETEGFTYNGSGVPVEIIELEANHFGLEVSFPAGDEQVKLPLKIDTAFDGGLVLFNKTIVQYGLMKKNKRYREVKGFGADPTITTNQRGKMKDVSFGGKYWKKVPVIFSTHPTNNEATQKSPGYGLIGQELLLDFNITYDYERELVYLEQR